MEELRLFKNAKPKKIQVDNGSEFTSKEKDKWAYEQKVELISLDQENQQIMLILNRSTAAFVMNAWTRIGFYHWKMLNKKYKIGKQNITPSDTIAV